MYEHGDPHRVAADIAPKIEDVLATIDVTRTIEEMDRPYFRPHPLANDCKGEWAVIVQTNWRAGQLAGHLPLQQRGCL